MLLTSTSYRSIRRARACARKLPIPLSPLFAPFGSPSYPVPPPPTRERWPPSCHLAPTSRCGQTATKSSSGTSTSLTSTLRPTCCTSATRPVRTISPLSLRPRRPMGARTTRHGSRPTGARATTDIMRPRPARSVPRPSTRYPLGGHRLRTRSSSIPTTHLASRSQSITFRPRYRARLPTVRLGAHPVPTTRTSTLGRPESAKRPTRPLRPLRECCAPPVCARASRMPGPGGSRLPLARSTCSCHRARFRLLRRRRPSFGSEEAPTAFTRTMPTTKIRTGSRLSLRLSSMRILASTGCHTPPTRCPMNCCIRRTSSQQLRLRKS